MSVQLRHESSVHPQSANMRRRHRLLNLFHIGRQNERENQFPHFNNDSSRSLKIHSSKSGRYIVQASRNLMRKVSGKEEEGDEEKEDRTPQRHIHQQYRLQAVRPISHHIRYLKWFGLGDARLTIYESTQTNDGCRCCGTNPNDQVIAFLHWIFRQHLVTVVITAALLYFVLTFGFALMIWWAGNNHPYCIGGTEYNPRFFVDAFTLSWTTFTTVVRVHVFFLPRRTMTALKFSQYFLYAIYFFGSLLFRVMVSFTPRFPRAMVSTILINVQESQF